MTDNGGLTSDVTSLLSSLVVVASVNPSLVPGSADAQAVAPPLVRLATRYCA